MSSWGNIPNADPEREDVSAGTAPADAAETPRLLFFIDSRSGASRRADGFLAQVLQHRGNHATFRLHRIDVSDRPDLAAKFEIETTPALLVVKNRRVRARLEQPRGSREIATLLKPWLQ